MIVADTSALVAVVLGEPDAERYLARIEDEETTVSAVSLVEARIVVEARQGPDATRDLGLLVEGAVGRVVPVDAEHADAAFGAWRRFGKGRHPAGLNLGDCFAYAAARLAGVPLLFKGDDFTLTDVASAL
ncbi:type II toxin-antitoxin system VapC family toxin [Nocardioides sp. KR10-350]|uniref:type II toxin-antitoxin system VapC family toxin n=1 Tax=Nocardioides cheoyonin TaxID=3156615 RepID=UPI0032B4048D